VNLLSPLPDARAAEQVATLLTRPGLRVERIVSLGQASAPGFWYDQAAGAASTSSPTSMSLSSASTVAALGMPLSDPCSASAPATTPQLQNVDLTESKSISLWFATDSPLWFPKQHWRTAAARQQDGCWSVSLRSGHP